MLAYLLEWKIIKPKVEGHFNRWKHSAHIKYPENKMYVFGGMYDALSCSNEVWCLNLSKILYYLFLI